VCPGAFFDSKGVFQFWDCAWFSEIVKYPCLTSSINTSSHFTPHILLNIVENNASIQDYSFTGPTTLPQAPQYITETLQLTGILVITTIFAGVFLKFLTKFLIWHSKSTLRLSKNSSKLVQRLHGNPDNEEADNTERLLMHTKYTETAMEGLFWGLSFGITKLLWNYFNLATPIEIVLCAMLAQCLLSMIMVVVVHLLLTAYGIVLLLTELWRDGKNVLGSFELDATRGCQ
jgi:hypothetical protein